MSVMSLEHIKKSFDGKEVLKDINLTVEEGEVVSILGPSGSENLPCFAALPIWRNRIPVKSTMGKAKTVK